ncbi:MAG TPA: type II CAAX endopeptidase family protein [Geothrix sp.]|nr:type II CAAX endopeptidase family protein [Geothrix sp.]
MQPEPRTPWQPAPRWADPFIALLLILACLAAGLSLFTRAKVAERPSEQVSLQGRLVEVALAAPQVLLGQKPKAAEWDRAAARLSDPWDAALLVVLRTELEPEAKSALPKLPSRGGEALHRVYLAAYEHGPMPSAQDRAETRRRLGRGYSASLLEARLQGPANGGIQLRTQARQVLLVRFALLTVLGLGVSGLSLGGLALGIYLIATRRVPPPPLPAWGLSGRAAAIVFLAWFLGFFLAGSLAGLLLSPWPSLRWLALPGGYLLHACFGLRLITWAEGLRFKDLWGRVAAGRPGKDLAWAIPFLALAVTLVLLVAMLSSWILAPTQNPQRDLQELLQGVSGWPTTLVLFLTVAGVAPVFEELFFRGFLLPVLARKDRMAWGLLASAGLFGAIHLQPAGLPILATLGWVLGLALRQTGSLRTPILLHACWNGTLFVLLRGMA